MTRRATTIRPKTPEQLEKILARTIDEFGLSGEILAVCSEEKVATVRDLYELSADSLVATEFRPEQVLVLRKLLSSLGLKRRPPRDLTPFQNVEVRCMVRREHRQLQKTQKPRSRNFSEENERYLSLLLLRDPVRRAFARQMLTIVNEPGVRSIAGRYGAHLSGALRAQDCSIDFEDLVSEGNFGLLRAAEEFDPRTGNGFFSYAVWWIRHFVQRYLADSGIIRIPEHLHQKATLLAQVLAKIPTDASECEERVAVCTAFNLGATDYEPFREVIKSLDLIQFPERLDRKQNEGLDDSSLLHELIVADGVSDTETSVNDAMLLHDLQNALEEAIKAIGLSDRSQKILWLRFGFGGDDDFTRETIGQIYGVTRERIRQIEGSALKSLREYKGWDIEQIKALLG